MKKAGKQGFAIALGLLLGLSGTALLGATTAHAEDTDYSFGDGYVNETSQCLADLESLGAKRDQDQMPIPANATPEQKAAIKLYNGKQKIKGFSFPNGVTVGGAPTSCLRLDENGCPDTPAGGGCFMDDTVSKLKRDCGYIKSNPAALDGPVDCKNPKHLTVYTNCWNAEKKAYDVYTSGPPNHSCHSPGDPIPPPNADKIVLELKQTSKISDANKNNKKFAANAPAIAQDLPCGRVCSYSVTVSTYLGTNKIGEQILPVSCAVDKGAPCPKVEDCMNPNKVKSVVGPSDPTGGNASSANQ